MYDHIHIYKRQHAGLKFVTVAFGIIAALFLSQRNIVLLLGGMLFFFIHSPQFYLKWLMLIIKMNYFWISFFLIGILFRIPFKQQFFTFSRVFLLLGFSVFIVKTMDFKQKSIPQKQSWKSALRHYILLTFQFIPLFMEQYKIEFAKNKSPLVVLEKTFQQCSQKANAMHLQENSSQPSVYPFYSYPNLFLSLFLLYLIILLAL